MRTYRDAMPGRQLAILGTSRKHRTLAQRFHHGNPEQIAELEQARGDDAVARKIHGLRTKAGLTQRQLAKLAGTTASVIFRLEDADYEGHSPAMLTRIATALNRRVEIRFLPLGSGSRRACA